MQKGKCFLKRHSVCPCVFNFLERGTNLCSCGIQFKDGCFKSRYELIHLTGIQLSATRWCFRFLGGITVNPTLIQILVLQNVNDLHLRNSSSSFSPSFIQSNCLLLGFYSPSPVLQGNNPLEPPKGIRSKLPKNLLSLKVIGFAAFVGVSLCHLYPTLVTVSVHTNVTTARGTDVFSSVQSSLG